MKPRDKTCVKPNGKRGRKICVQRFSGYFIVLKCAFFAYIERTSDTRRPGMRKLQPTQPSLPALGAILTTLSMLFNYTGTLIQCSQAKP